MKRRRSTPLSHPVRTWSVPAERAHEHSVALSPLRQVNSSASAVALSQMRATVRKSQSVALVHALIQDRDHLRVKSPHSITLYQRWVDLVRARGPVKIVPVRTRIGSSAHDLCRGQPNRRGLSGRPFCAGAPHYASALSAHQVLGPRTFVHHLRLCARPEPDATLGEWICEAYAVGEQKRLPPAHHDVICCKWFDWI